MKEEERQKAIEKYIQNDHFMAHLGAKMEVIEPGYSRISLTVIEAMLKFRF